MSKISTHYFICYGCNNDFIIYNKKYLKSDKNRDSISVCIRLKLFKECDRNLKSYQCIDVEWKWIITDKIIDITMDIYHIYEMIDLL